MFVKFASFALAACIVCAPGFAQNPNEQTPEQAAITAAAQQLAAMPFDANAPVTARGRVASIVFALSGKTGMIVIEDPQSGQRYAFSTAGTRDMSKQGFSRFTMRPGEEVTVTGILAEGGKKIGPGFTAAKADTITKSDGTRVFDRSRLPN
ncbi:MAG TPA: hypothetical protein VFW83_04540 [Bryobacteraceae bacterium]|nr:hypothetical protein [Bryobacteraceae bacterium]